MKDNKSAPGTPMGNSVWCGGDSGRGVKRKGWEAGVFEWQQKGIEVVKAIHYLGRHPSIQKRYISIEVRVRRA